MLILMQWKKKGRQTSKQSTISNSDPFIFLFSGVPITGTIVATEREKKNYKNRSQTKEGESQQQIAE